MVKIPLSFGVGLPRDHPPSPCCSSDRRKFQGHRRQRSVHARAICRSTRTHFRLSSSAVGWTPRLGESKSRFSGRRRLATVATSEYPTLENISIKIEIYIGTVNPFCRCCRTNNRSTRRCPHIHLLKRGMLMRKVKLLR